MFLPMLRHYVFYREAWPDSLGGCGFVTRRTFEFFQHVRETVGRECLILISRQWRLCTLRLRGTLQRRCSS